MNHHLRTGLLVSFFVFLLPHPLSRAAEESAEELYENAVQEHVQVTATRTKKRDLDIAAAVTAISEQQVREMSPDVIAEMLRAEPGTFFQQTTPGQGIPIIRGLKGSQVLHMVDGMRLNNAFFRNAPNQYLGLVDPFTARRMEVVRGAQGSLYGADAMGGVLNILTHEPHYDGKTWQQEGRLYASFDSVDDGFVVSARTRGGRQGRAMAGGVSYQDHASRKSGSGERLTPSAYRSKAADLKFVLATGGRSNLMLLAQLVEQASTPRYDELVPGFGQQEPSSEQFLFEPNRRSFVHARFRLDGQSGWFDQVEAHAARQVITDDRLTQAWMEPVIVTEHNRSTLDGITLQFNSSPATGPQLVWGAEYYTDAIDSSRFEQIEGTDLLEMVRGRFPDGSSMDSSAVYLSAEWPGSERLALNTGLRYSWFSIKLPADQNHDTLELTPSDLTGDIHAVYTLGPELKLVANIGRGFRPPNIFDLATLGPRPGNRFNITNPGLSPESVWSYDLGIKAETGRTEFEAFVFYLDYANKITSVFTGETSGDGRDIVRSENRNSVQLYGFETGLYWNLNGELSGFAVINYTRGEERGIDGPAIPADRIPPLNGKLGLEYHFNGDWLAKPYLLFAGKQDRLSPRDIRDPRINPDGTDAWVTLNLLLDWQASDSLQLGLRLENLTNEHYREHASGIDAPGRNIGLWINYTAP